MIANVRTVSIPRSVLADTYDLLREAGAEGLESIALWAGSFTDDPRYFSVSAVILPTQVASRTEHGLLATVDGDEIFRVNQLLSANNLRLIAQLHTHPSDAYHSDTDDAFPLLSARGSLSIVIPNFAREALDLDRCAIYRLETQSRWRELSLVEVRALINLIDDL